MRRDRHTKHNSENQPGGSQIISVSMLATGSRTESWSLTWDDSNLPEGWSFQSSSGQNTNPTLTPGIAQNFDSLLQCQQML